VLPDPWAATAGAWTDKKILDRLPVAVFTVRVEGGRRSIPAARDLVAGLDTFAEARELDHG
jgi:hypothetical protein